MAITSFIVALGSLLLCGLTGPIAIPFGIVSLRQINAQVNNGEPKQKGEWMAVTGTVIGSLSLVVLIAILFNIITA